MNAEDFYQEFKSALTFIGAGFSQMNLATVKIVDEQVIVTFAGKSAIFAVTEENKNDPT